MKNKVNLISVLCIAITIILSGCAASDKDYKSELQKSENEITALKSQINDLENSASDYESILKDKDDKIEQLQAELENHEDKDEQTLEKETYEYKGITLPGSYSGDMQEDEHILFHVDRDFLYYGDGTFTGEVKYSKEGLPLFFTSSRAIYAYLANDTEKLFKYFDNEEDINKQQKIMEEKTSMLNGLDVLILSTMCFDTTRKDDYFTVTYQASFDFMEYYDYTYLTMTMYLNNDGEWKVKEIF